MREKVRVFYDELWSSATAEKDHDQFLNEVRSDCLQRARDLVRGKRRKRMLIIGCGEGSEILDFSRDQKNIIALDLSLESLKKTRALLAQKNPGAALFCVQADTHHLPFREGSLDALYMALVLMHLDAAAAAGEWKRTLARGGDLVIVEPLNLHPVAWLFRTFFSIFRPLNPRYLSRSQIRDLGAGWGRVAQYDFYLLLPFFLPCARIRILRQLFLRLLPALHAADRALLRVFPFLSPWAWMNITVISRNE